MIQFVWIIINDTPVAGMKFIKISDQEERARLEKFYGWLSGPVSAFSGKVQDIIVEDTKYFYHTNNGVLFVVGTDLGESGIPSIFIPELEEKFFEMFPPEAIANFDGSNIQQFRAFDQTLLALVREFGQRKSETTGKRKALDAFEVLNLPSELQMVALVLVKLQVVTPEMVSQVSGIPPETVEQHLREIYQRGYLYLTTISNKSYFSIKPFGADTTPGIISRRRAAQARQSSPPSTTPPPSPSPPPMEAKKVPQPPPPESSVEPEVSSPKEQSAVQKFSLEDLQETSDEGRFASVESAMMPPPGWSSIKPEDRIDLSAKSAIDESTSKMVTESGGRPIQPQLEEATGPSEAVLPPMMAEKNLPIGEDLSPLDRAEQGRLSKAVNSVKGRSKGIALKEDFIAKEIDSKFRMSVVIPRKGTLPPDSLRREKTFIFGKLSSPSPRKKNPFLLRKWVKRNLENLMEALFLGDFVAIVGESEPVQENNLVEELFETMDLLTPHRKLLCTKSNVFLHPKDADVIYIPRSLLKYYSWATILDLDEQKVIGGKSSDFSKNLVKKMRKINRPKEFLKELTKEAAVLMDVCQKINTLKIEGRPPEKYLDEVKKTYGVAVLDAGLDLSEKLIRLYKDCAYIAGFYIRKGLDIVVRAILVGDPIVVIGDDPLNVFHVIESIAIFAPHKATEAQIWTTDFAGIAIEEFDIMGAQEGTDKLFKDAVKVNLRSYSAYGGPRSQFIHSFLRRMWRHRSKERPPFIREELTQLLQHSREIIKKFDSLGKKQPSKDEIRALFKDFEEPVSEVFVDLIRKERPDIAAKIRDAL